MSGAFRNGPSLVSAAKLGSQDVSAIYSVSTLISQGGGGGGDYAAQAVHFDGSAFLQRGALLTGVTSPDTLLSSVWLKLSASAIGNILWATYGNNSLAVQVDSDRLRLTLLDSGNNTAQMAGDYAQDAWFHILQAFDWRDESKCRTLVNGIDVTDVLGFSMVGGISFNGETDVFVMSDGFADTVPGDVADFFLAFGQWLDLTSPANVAKFISAGKPVDLGSDGSIPTGIKPTIFFTGDHTAFPTNQGTGGTFTLTGSLTEASTSPSDDVAPSPVLSSATGTKTGATTADLSVSTDTGSGTLYWIVSTSATPPSAAQVLVGHDSTGSNAAASGTSAISATGVQSIPGGATGLTGATTYYAYFVQHTSVNSNVAASSSFTTDIAATPITMTGTGDPVNHIADWTLVSNSGSIDHEDGALDPLGGTMVASALKFNASAVHFASHDTTPLQLDADVVYSFEGELAGGGWSGGDISVSRWLAIWIEDIATGNNTIGAYFNFGTGEIGGDIVFGDGVGLQKLLTADANGYYKFKIVGKFTSTHAACQAIIRGANADGTPTGVDGQTFSFYGVGA